MLVKIKFGVFGRYQSLEIGFGLCRLTATCMPPRRFRCKIGQWDEESGPHPLHGKGDPVGPLISSLQQPSNAADGQELTKCPTEVDVVGQVCPKT